MRSSWVTLAVAPESVAAGGKNGWLHFGCGVGLSIAYNGWLLILTRLNCSSQVAEEKYMLDVCTKWFLVVKRDVSVDVAG